MAVEQALDGIDLRCLEGRVEPHAHHIEPVTFGDLDDSAARSTGRIGVVEDDPPRTLSEPVVEILGKSAQRPAPLVAIQSLVTLGYETLYVLALAGCLDPHHDDHLTVHPRGADGSDAPERTGGRFRSGGR